MSNLTKRANARHLHYAPYLDYRPLREDEPKVDALFARPEFSWITRDLEQKALGHAIAEVVPEHLKEVRDRRYAWIEKARAAVKDRLTKEIGYWDHRAEELKIQEQAGRPNARVNSQEARRRADELQGRLQKRMEQLDLEAQVSALPPVALGGLVVVPAGLLAQMTGTPLPVSAQAVDTQAAAARARAIIMEVERSLGFEPTDREFDKLGYDIESRETSTGRLRFLEVKGRVSGAATITVTKNEILYSLNKPEDFILAIVEFLGEDEHRVHYVRRPFHREPDFGVTSVNYDFAELLSESRGAFMKILNPQAPFIWPTPRLFDEPSIYEQSPPFGGLVLTANWLFGIVPALTSRGVRVLGEWLDSNVELKLSIIVVVYPACATRQSDLDGLR